LRGAAKKKEVVVLSKKKEAVISRWNELNRVSVSSSAAESESS
jgi:hypothetical protein